MFEQLNDLLRGKFGKFSLEALVNLTAAAGSYAGEWVMAE